MTMEWPDTKSLFRLIGAFRPGWTFLAGIFGITIGLFVFLIHVAPGPEASYESSFVEFGSLFPGETAERQILVTNVGRQPLHIEEAKLSCGCASAVISSSELSIGETAEICVTLKARSRSGPLEEWMVLRTNDRQQPLHKFTLDAFIGEGVSFSPSIVDFGSVHEASLPIRQNVTLSVPPDFMSSDLIPISNDQHVRVEVEKSTDVAGKRRIAVELLSGAPIGPVGSHVRFRFAGVERSLDSQLRLHGQVYGITCARPRSLIVGPVNSGPWEREFHLHCESGTLRLESVSVSESIDDLVSVEHTRIDKRETICRVRGSGNQDLTEKLRFEGWISAKVGVADGPSSSKSS